MTDESSCSVSVNSFELSIMLKNEDSPKQLSPSFHFHWPPTFFLFVLWWRSRAWGTKASDDDPISTHFSYHLYLFSAEHLSIELFCSLFPLYVCSFLQVYLSSQFRWFKPEYHCLEPSWPGLRWINTLKLSAWTDYGSVKALELFLIITNLTHTRESNLYSISVKISFT